jgi:hypothetical protein
MTVADLITELEKMDQSLYVVTADDFPGIMLVPLYLLRRNDREVQAVPIRQ